MRERKARMPIRRGEKTTYMLDDLDGINWVDVEHAYGTATDVPDNIRALMSDDPSAHKQALEALYNTIAHQGSVYSATAVAVPFLIELVDTPTVLSRDDILSLLTWVAFGHYWDTYEEPRQGKLVQPSAIGERVYNVVRAGIPVYLHVLDKETELRASALGVLCRFRADSALIAPHLRSLLDTETDPDLFDALVLSLSYFDIDDPWPIELCDRILRAEQVSVRTMVAAISRMRLDIHQPSFAAVRVLARLMADSQPLTTTPESVQLLMNGATTPSTILEHVTEDAALVAAPILVAGLAWQTEEWLFRDLARTIVAMLFSNPNLSLTADERLADARVEAVRALMDHAFMESDYDSFLTLRPLLPAVFREGVLGRGTAGRQWTAEQHTVLQALLRNEVWSSRGSDVYALAEHLLALFFSSPEGYEGMPLLDLTAEQRAILAAIEGSGYWEVDIINASDGVSDAQSMGGLLRSFGLPDTPQALRAYLQSKT